MDRVWPHAAVEEANLSVNVSLLRRALGAQEDGRPWIETVPRRGYRFLAGRGGPGRAGAPSLAGDSALPASRPARRGRLPGRRPGRRPHYPPRAPGADHGPADGHRASLRRSRPRGGRAGDEGGRGPHRQPPAGGDPAESHRSAGASQRSRSEPWAGAFEEEVTNPFAVEDAVAAQLARALGMEEEEAQCWSRPPRPHRPTSGRRGLPGLHEGALLLEPPHRGVTGPGVRLLPGGRGEGPVLRATALRPGRWSHPGGARGSAAPAPGLGSGGDRGASRPRAGRDTCGGSRLARLPAPLPRLGLHRGGGRAEPCARS